MKIFSLTTIAVVAVFAYVCHTVYVIYGVWNPSPCPSNKNNRCVLPYKPSNDGRWNVSALYFHCYIFPLIRLHEIILKGFVVGTEITAKLICRLRYSIVCFMSQNFPIRKAGHPKY